MTFVKPVGSNIFVVVAFDGLQMEVLDRLFVCVIMWCWGRAAKFPKALTIREFTFLNKKSHQKESEYQLNTSTKSLSEQYWQAGKQTNSVCAISTAGMNW